MTANELDRLDALHAAMTSGEWEDGGEASISTTFDHEANIYPPAAKPGEDQVGGPLAVVNARGDGREDNARGIVALHNSYPALSAAVRAAWVERDGWKQRAIAAESTLESCPTCHVPSFNCDCADRLAARLAEAEELLRRFVDDSVETYYCGEMTCGGCDFCRAAAFLARTETR